jgi:hypothetical protein
MKRLLSCLAILVMVSLLSVGCATSSGGGRQSTGATTNSSGSPTPPPGEVYTPPVAVPPANP